MLISNSIFLTSSRQIAAFFGLVALVAFLAPGAASAQSELVLDEIVAVVDGDIILRSEVDALVLGVAQQQRITPSDELWFDALSELVDQKTLLVYARRDTTVQIAPEQVSGEIDQRIQALSQQAGSQSRLEELYGKTVAEIKAELTPPVRDQLLAAEYQRRYLQNITVTPTDVKEWFHRIPQDSLPTLAEIVRVAHVVRLPDLDPAARE